MQFQPNVVVPDMEDSVPPQKKADARKMISKICIFMMFLLNCIIDSKLSELRSKMPSSTYIFPRPNDLETGWFHDDINEVVCKNTRDKINGF